MKNSIKTFLIILSALVTVSCQKVIDVDLNAASPKYVIEGGVNNTAEPCRIRITKTSNFSDDNNFDVVSNALVSISDNAGNSATLNYVNQGIYEAASFQGVPGRVYFLIVKIDNETFTSSSQMPHQVEMDSLYNNDFTGFGDTIKMVNIQYADPAAEKNSYRFILTLNDTVRENIFIGDDEFNNGKLVVRNFFFGNGRKSIKTGDSVSIEMRCIDKEVYNFFFTLNQTISQSSAAPTNPISNIAGGALGYFSAYTVQIKSIKIQ